MTDVDVDVQIKTWFQNFRHKQKKQSQARLAAEMAATEGASTSLRQEHGQQHQPADQPADQQQHELPARQLPPAMGYDYYWILLLTYYLLPTVRILL